MDAAGDRPLAIVLLVRGGREVLLGPVYGSERCDLGAVDDLLRLQLAVRRLGWSIRLAEIRGNLGELVELVGLTTDLVD